jgi:hypothetical protein
MDAGTNLYPYLNSMNRPDLYQVIRRDWFQQSWSVTRSTGVVVHLLHHGLSTPKRAARVIAKA